MRRLFRILMNEVTRRHVCSATGDVCAQINMPASAPEFLNFYDRVGAV